MTSLQPPPQPPQGQNNLQIHPPPVPAEGTSKVGRQGILKVRYQGTTALEGDVQLAINPLRMQQKFDPVTPSSPYLPSVRNTPWAPLLRLTYLQTQHREKMKKLHYLTTEFDRIAGEEMMTDCHNELLRPKPFQLVRLLEAEHFAFVAECARRKERMDPNLWMAKLGHLLRTDERYRGVMFVDEDDAMNRRRVGVSYLEELEEEFGGGDQKGEVVWNEGVCRAEMERVKATCRTRLLDLITKARQTAEELRQKSRTIFFVRKKKFELQLRYQQIYYTLNSEDAKFDEMSITGNRGLKMFMDYPYFKTQDGMASLKIPLTVLAPHAAVEDWSDWFSQFERQKWTLKDLDALRLGLRESVISNFMEDINCRYGELLEESDKRRIEEMRNEGRRETDIYKPPAKRKRGRPSKAETSMRDKYGIVYPVISTTDPSSPAAVAVFTILPKQLSDWRSSYERRWRRMKFETLLKEPGAIEGIDWADIAHKTMLRTRKIRTEKDCKVTFINELDPKISSTRIPIAQMEKAKALFEVHGLSWGDIADQVNSEARGRNGLPLTTKHTPFQFFQKYIMKYSKRDERNEWTSDMDKKLKEAVPQHPGNWSKIAAEVGHEAVTKITAIERYKKTCPMIKSGAFSRVEDCLLILAIHQFRAFISEEGHFGFALPFLPWRWVEAGGMVAPSIERFMNYKTLDGASLHRADRYEAAWRDRAHNLFHDWIVPWTLEEDRLLLELEKKYPSNWQKISEYFATSFKNRKGCLTRWKILQKNVKKGKYASLEEYHEAYSITRYNVFQYKHLDEILKMLQKVVAAKVPPNKVYKLDEKMTRSPTDNELKCVLITYDNNILTSAVRSLERYIRERNDYWEAWSLQFGDKKKTFDRRTFRPEDPQSVASAIHMRFLKLKPKSDVPAPLTTFEEEVYRQYARFSKTKALNRKLERPHLPPASFFLQWDAVSRVIVVPKGKMTDLKKPHSKKWMKFLDQESDYSSSSEEEEQVESDGEESE